MRRGGHRPAALRVDCHRQPRPTAWITTLTPRRSRSEVDRGSGIHAAPSCHRARRRQHQAASRLAEGSVWTPAARGVPKGRHACPSAKPTSVQLQPEPSQAPRLLASAAAREAHPSTPDWSRDASSTGRARRRQHRAQHRRGRRPRRQAQQVAVSHRKGLGARGHCRVRARPNLRRTPSSRRHHPRGDRRRRDAHSTRSMTATCRSTATFRRPWTRL